MILVLSLVFWVIDELPQHNLPAAFLFLLQVPVGWAALRRAMPSLRARRLAVAQETALALALQVSALITTWGLAQTFQASDRIRLDVTNPPLVFLILTACAGSYLADRLLIFFLTAWRRLIEKRLLWRIVNTNLVTVLTLIVLVSVIARIGAFTTEPANTYYPSSLLATLVLEFVRAVVPWVGISLLFAFAAIAAFFLPTLFTSYLTARGVVRRISELAQAMKSLRQGQFGARVKPQGEDEVAQLQDDFNYMADELQQEREKVARLLKNQRELVAVISHELRTPVTVMRAYIENDLMENPEPLPEHYRADLQILHHETLTLQGLIEDLFTLSQIDANRFDLTCCWMDGAGVIARVAAGLQKVAWDNKRIDLCAQPQLNLPDVWADERRLEQVLSNLIQNAIRHTPHGGVILIQAQPVDNALLIAVVDSGEGIAPENLPRVWERFYRGKNGAGRTGIGLALVKELVEAMDGSVGVESQPGEGSRFWLRLKASATAG